MQYITQLLINITVDIYINNLNNLIMPYFIFDKNRTIKAKKVVDDKLKEKLSKISPTPFPLDFEEVEKTITLTMNDTGKQYDLHSTSKNIKVGNFCIVLQTLGSVAPMWISKCPTAALLIMYIIRHLEMSTNAVEISEKEFCLYANCNRRSFYNALDAVVRPECNHPCAGDSMALLARTTRKSIYVVNHNFIYRGNYDEFVTIYEQKFPDGCKLDSKGRVIID